MARNEKTGPRAAHVAGHILAMCGARGSRVRLIFDLGRGESTELDMPLADLCALAASALTQAPNRQPAQKRKLRDEEPALEAWLDDVSGAKLRAVPGGYPAPKHVLYTETHVQPKRKRTLPDWPSGTSLGKRTTDPADIDYSDEVTTDQMARIDRAYRHIDKSKLKSTTGSARTKPKRRSK